MIDASSIPVSAAGRKLLANGTIGIEKVVSGGDDYEILCTISEDCYESFAQQANQAAVTVTTIGTVIAGNANPRFLDLQGRELTLARLSYSHF